MPLYANRTDYGKYATEDIICYKAMKYNDGVYKTAFTQTPVDKEIIDGIRPLFPKEETIETEIYTSTPYNLKVVGRGGIHTYSSLDELHKVWHPYESFSVFECVIPAGTKYYEDYRGIEYASQRLYFRKRIYDNNPYEKE